MQNMVRFSKIIKYSSLYVISKNIGQFHAKNEWHSEVSILAPLNSQNFSWTKSHLTLTFTFHFTGVTHFAITRDTIFSQSKINHYCMAYPTISRRMTLFLSSSRSWNISTEYKRAQNCDPWSIPMYKFWKFYTSGEIIKDKKIDWHIKYDRLDNFGSTVYILHKASSKT